MKNRIIRDSEIVSNMVCPDVKPTCETKESDNHTTMLHDCKVSFGLHYMQRMILLMIHDGKIANGNLLHRLYIQMSNVPAAESICETCISRTRLGCSVPQ